MTIEITDLYRVAAVNYFAARARQTPEEYVIAAIDCMIEADEREKTEGGFTTLKEAMENRSEAAAA